MAKKSAQKAMSHEDRDRLAGRDAMLCFAEYGDGRVRPFRLFLPTRYQFAPEMEGVEAPRFPLAVMMHGGGSPDYPCDENWYFLNKEAPDRVQTIAEERGYVVACPAMPFTRVSGQDPDRRTKMLREIREETVPFIQNLIKDVTYNFHADPERVYLIGASRGGFALYALATAEPERYAAVVPVCTAALPEQLDAVAKTPTLIMHAVEDSIFPIEGARELKQELEKRGCDVKMEELPGPHSGFRYMEAYRMMFDWLDTHPGRPAPEG